ncbi:MAG: transglutaminase [Deltaproteobacteria bacterium HGW-Deltaproteobacteria-6]|jgi:transglutaminase-like putative cysteine protease|nr:MAG: transglutaminase [Deltaproteobacteria bacterium HGW-Deltaproteobacteria-6]
MHEDYLKPTEFMDSDSPEIQAFAQQAVEGAATPREKAVKLYYAVRDGIYYDPYRIEPSRSAFKASTILRQGYGYCVAKAVVLAAVLRAQVIPCKLHFADVRNHLTTKRLKALMQTDTFFYHGYNDVFLDGAWIKVTPTFNLSLCEKFKVKPLDWDGVSDAVFHPFDLEGRRHMEYITDHGSFADLPYDAIINTFLTCYGDMAKNQLYQTIQAGDFEREAQEESLGK